MTLDRLGPSEKAVANYFGREPFYEDCRYLVCSGCGDFIVMPAGTVMKDTTNRLCLNCRGGVYMEQLGTRVEVRVMGA